MTSIKDLVEDYFTSLSPTSRRLMTDMKDIKKSQESWNQLPEEEQSNLLWKALVKSDIEEKYALYPKSTVDVEYFPVLKINPGEKIVLDEDTTSGKNQCSWRDEHSAPFTWETKSQLNLRLDDFEKSESSMVEETPKSEDTPSDANPPKVTAGNISLKEPPPTDDPILMTMRAAGIKVEAPQAFPKKEDTPKIQSEVTPPPPLPTKETLKEKPPATSVSPAADETPPSPSQIPKTGFDFLDNW